MSFFSHATKCLPAIRMLAYTFSMYKSTAVAGMVDVYMSSIRYRFVKHQGKLFGELPVTFAYTECKVVDFTKIKILVHV